MPIRIPDNLPAGEILNSENIFVMFEDRAYHQDIRPLKIVILNIMPTKITTETQLLRLLGNTPLQIEIVFLYPASHMPKNTTEEHLAAFYKTFEEIRDEHFDGLIITGAPVEQMPFEQVNYWEELTQIMDWSLTNVYSTLHICWGAQAGMYYHFGVQKYDTPYKIFGVFPHTKNKEHVKLLRGFDDIFYVPHSRHTEVRHEDIAEIDELEILSESEESGVYLVASKDGRHIFATGHSEYDPLTLKSEYQRDVERGINVAIPKNYFPNDDPKSEPIVRWRGHGTLLFLNWLNYYVYQETPYDLTKIGK